MVLRKTFDGVLRHKHALLFAGGIAAAIVGKKILESEMVKEATTNAVASVMAVKKDAEDKVEEIRLDAEAIVCEDEEEVEEKVEIEIEEVEEKPKKTTKKSKKSKK